MKNIYRFEVLNNKMEIIKSFEFENGLLSTEALNFIKACSFNGDLKELRMIKNNRLEKVFTVFEVLELINMSK